MKPDGAACPAPRQVHELAEVFRRLRKVERGIEGEVFDPPFAGHGAEPRRQPDVFGRDAVLAALQVG